MKTIWAYVVIIGICLILGNIALYLHNKQRTKVIYLLKKSAFTSANNELKELYSNPNTSSFPKPKSVTKYEYSIAIANSFVQRIDDIQMLCNRLGVQYNNSDLIFYTYLYNYCFVDESLQCHLDYRSYKYIMSEAHTQFSKFSSEEYLVNVDSLLDKDISKLLKIIKNPTHHSNNVSIGASSLSCMTNEYISHITSREQDLSSVSIIEISRLFLSWVPNEHLIINYKVKV